MTRFRLRTIFLFIAGAALVCAYAARQPYPERWEVLIGACLITAVAARYMWEFYQPDDDT